MCAHRDTEAPYRLRPLAEELGLEHSRLRSAAEREGESRERTVIVV